MNKSLIALAVLGAFAGTVSAQSSVTIGGTVDLGARNVSNSGKGSVQSLTKNGLSSSALRFFGTEDMGGGLKASFWYETDISPDTGAAGAGASFWNRRATVGLIGRFGEVRLGRDYTPSYWNNAIFDPFGNLGVGSGLNLGMNAIGTTSGGPVAGQPTHTRADNSVGYFLPAMGGIYGQAMVAAGEGNLPNKYAGARLGFATGPFNVAVGIGRQYLTGGRYNTWNFGGSYDLGVAKLMGLYSREENTSLAAASPFRENNRFTFGGVVPMGQGSITASYTRLDVKNTSNDATQIALGYQYSLSKRTTLYGTVSRLDNKGAATYSIGAVGVGGSHTSAPVGGGNSTGMEAGLRHTF